MQQTAEATLLSHLKIFTSQTKIQRKTRISFELDPMLILGDQLEETFHDEDDFSDIDFSHLKTGSNYSNMDLWGKLLQL